MQGPLNGEELARHLYGVQGTIGPWLRLLDRLLLDHEEFIRDQDGCWTLKNEVAKTPLLLAARRTRARGGRLAELALTPADSDRILWRWRFDTRPRDPGGPLPVPDADADLWTVFQDATEDLVSILESRELLVLDSSLVSLLSSELERCGLSPLTNSVSVLGLDLWRAKGDKQSVEEVRDSLGLTPITADALAGEIELLRALHLRGWGQGSAADGDKAGDISALRASVLDLPESPGVYLLRDSAGDALYVGSASNLRRRILSYFGEQIDLSRGLRGLLPRAAHIDHLCFGTHLEAVLEEATLIASLQPPYNVQRNVSAQAAWLRIGAEYPVNVVQVASSPRNDGALYLGPLPNKAAVNAAAAVLSKLWGLRRRGGSSRRCEVSTQRLDYLRVLLSERDRFCIELRQRLHACRDSLSPRAWFVLSEQVERTERAVLSGELEPQVAASDSALVASYDERTAQLYLVIVRDLQLLACVRVNATDQSAIRGAIAHLLALSIPLESALPTERTLTSRWLHLHRNEPWVRPVDLQTEEIASRIETAVDERHAVMVRSLEPTESEW